MAHELTNRNDGTVELAYSSDHGTPWHGLGTPVAGLGTVDEMLAAARLDWLVEKAPLLIPDPHNPDRIIETDRCWTYRRNPETGETEYFGVVGTDYTVIQARTMVETGMAVAGFNPSAKAIDTLGSIRNGAQVFCTIPLPDWIIDPAGIGDVIARQYALMSDHTGRSSFKLLRSDTRVVCANTLRFAQDRAQWEVSIRHTSGAADIPVAWIKDRLGFLLDSDERFIAQMYGMLGAAGDWSTVTTLADKLWPVKVNDTTGLASKRSQTIRAQRMAELEVIWSTEVDRTGRNAYGVYQTLQGYLQHVQGNTRGTARTERSVAGLQGATFQRQCARLAELVVA